MRISYKGKQEKWQSSLEDTESKAQHCTLLAIALVSLLHQYSIAFFLNEFKYSFLERVNNIVKTESYRLFSYVNYTGKFNKHDCTCCTYTQTEHWASPFVL